MKKGKSVTAKTATKKGNGKDLIPAKEQKTIQKKAGEEMNSLEAARERMKKAETEEIKPEQLNFNSVTFNDGDKKDFVFLKIEQIQDKDGDWYDACVLEDSAGSQVTNADIVLMNTLRPLENEAPFAIRVTCSGLVQPKSGNKPYKNLTILKF